MFSSKDGKMIILSSPSGAGKTTLVKKISKEKNFKISVDEIIKKDDKIVGILTGRQKEPLLPIEYHNDESNTFARPPKK